MSEKMEIKYDGPSTSNRSTFFSSHINKGNFVKFLAEKLQKNVLVLYGVQWTQTQQS